jgi:hypothetical protein
MNKVIEAKPIFKTKAIKLGQQLFIIFSGLLIVIDLLFLIFSFSLSMLLLFSIHLCVTVFLNYSFGKIYSIKISNKIITIENTWRKINYPLDSLKNITVISFVFLYPFNPYLKFEFIDGRDFAAMVENRFKVYLAKGGMETYISNLKEILLTENHTM